MFILDVCQNTNVLLVIYYAKVALKVIFFVIPIILIVRLTLDIYHNIVSNNDETKEIIKKMSKRIIACIIMFLIYPVVNILFGLEVFEGVKYLECFNNATTLSQIKSYNKSIYLNVNPSEIEGSTTLQCFGVNGCQFKLPSAKRNNFTFLGWSTTSDCTSIVNSEYYTTTTEINLYACFKQNESSTSPKYTKKSADYTIFVGDSRTEGMCSYLKKKMKSTESCVAEIGKSLSWFKSTAIPKINKILQSDTSKTYNIVIDLGINGLNPDNGIKYASTYNDLKNNEWSNQNLVIVSVTPVNPSKYGSSYNTKIQKFNTNLKNNLNSNISYCDIFDSVLSLIKDRKTIEPDGLHYTAKGSESIYKLKNNCLN